MWLFFFLVSTDSTDLHVVKRETVGSVSGYLCNLGTPAKHRSTLLVDTWSTYGGTYWPTLNMSSGLQVDMSADYQSICQSTSVGPVSVNMLADMLPNS